MTFPARYPGRCGGCDQGIQPGDEVEYVDEQLVHAGCIPMPEVETEPRPVCPTCFTTIALNGACLC